MPMGMFREAGAFDPCGMVLLAGRNDMGAAEARVVSFGQQCHSRFEM